MGGGIPVCWPQFNVRGPLAKHGFARTSDEWEVASMDGSGDPTLVLSLKDSEATRAAWPFSFELTLTVVLGEKALKTSMEVNNVGDADMNFTTALHTYFRVSDVTQIY